MEYTTFGKTGVTVSRLGFGGAVLGLKDYLGSYDPSDERARRLARSALEKAVELGVTHLLPAISDRCVVREDGGGAR